jgi:hypothetical protein
MFAIYLLNLLGVILELLVSPGSFWWLKQIGVYYLKKILCLTNTKIHISKKPAEKPTHVVCAFDGPIGSYVDFLFLFSNLG